MMMMLKLHLDVLEASPENNVVGHHDVNQEKIVTPL
jgi:hypothetical protein